MATATEQLIYSWEAGEDGAAGGITVNVLPAGNGIEIRFIPRPAPAVAPETETVEPEPEIVISGPTSETVEPGPETVESGSEPEAVEPETTSDGENPDWEPDFVEILEPADLPADKPSETAPEIVEPEPKPSEPDPEIVEPEQETVESGSEPETVEPEAVESEPETATGKVEIEAKALKQELRKLLPIIKDTYTAICYIEGEELHLKNVWKHAIIRLDVKPGSTGRVWIDHEDLIKRLGKACNGETITFSCTSNKTTAETKASWRQAVITWSISTDRGFATDNFQTTEICTVSEAGLKTLLRESLPAVPKTETRYALESVALFTEPSKLKAVSTDAHRLVASSVTASVASPMQDGAEPVLIPKATAEAVYNLLNGGEAVKISTSERTVCFEAETWTVTSDMLEGQFPNYKKVIPNNFDFHSKINRLELLERLKTLRDFLKAGTHKKDAIIIKSRRASLILKATDSEENESMQNVQADNKGDLPETGVNVNYLIDYLQAIDEETVRMKRRYEPDEVVPGVMVWSVQERDSMYLVMPLKLK